MVEVHSGPLAAQTEDPETISTGEVKNNSVDLVEGALTLTVVVAAAVLVVVLVEEAVADFLVAAAEVILGAALQFRVEFQGLEGADNMPNNAPRILAGARICY